MNFVEAIAFAVEKVKAWVNENKQDKLTGTEGQVVGFNAEGKPVAQEASGGGASHWDQLEGKPFVKVGGDTLTWDGNTEGLDVLFGALYKVSASVPTRDDFINGYILNVVLTTNSEIISETTVDGEAALAEYDEGSGESLVTLANGCVAIVLEDVTLEDGTIVYAGMYFNVDNGGFRCNSITIPGYTGFTKEQIDPNVLPEALQFGKTTVQSDTLEWDGNTEGLATLDLNMGFLFYRVSDIALNVDDFKNGCVSFFSNGEATELSQEEVQAIFNENGAFLMTFVCSIGEELANTVGAQAGTYFGKYDESAGGMHAASLTIPGYGGFTRTEVKTIEPEYLPGAVVLYADAGKYLYADSDTSDTSKRITKAQLLEMVLSGRQMYFCFEDGASIYSAITVVAFGEQYAEVPFDGADYHTAEYTA